jgi:hypothetical protein
MDEGAVGSWWMTGGATITTCKPPVRLVAGGMKKI